MYRYKIAHNKHRWHEDIVTRHSGASTGVNDEMESIRLLRFRGGPFALWVRGAHRHRCYAGTLEQNSDAANLMSNACFSCYDGSKRKAAREREREALNDDAWKVLVIQTSARESTSVTDLGELGDKLEGRKKNSIFQSFQPKFNASVIIRTKLTSTEEDHDLRVESYG